MSYRVLISDEALFDITEASFWYESQKQDYLKSFKKS